MTIATLLKDSSTNVSESKQAPWVVRADAQQRNEKYITQYSEEQIAKGERLHKFVDDTFRANRTFLNYRQKFIAIKVEGVTLAEASYTHTALLEDLCDLSNVKIVTRGSNVIFRIAK